MPRSNAGIYTLPEVLFIPGTGIRNTPVNNDLSDIAQAISGSMPLNGSVVMSSQFRASEGAPLTPSITFENSQGTGFYLSGTNSFRMVNNGILTAIFSQNGTTNWTGSTVNIAGNVICSSITANTVALANNSTVGGFPITNFPSGTITDFRQTTAPVGWTKIITDNNTALRLVDGTIGTGGTLDFTTAFGQTATGNTALSLAQMAQHRHFCITPLTNVTTSFTQPAVTNNNFVATALDATGALSPDRSYTLSGFVSEPNIGNASIAGSNAAHNHPFDTRTLYVDIIVASKD